MLADHRSRPLGESVDGEAESPAYSRITLNVLRALLNPPTAAVPSLVAVRWMLASLAGRASAGTFNWTVAMPSAPAPSSSVGGSTAMTLPR